MRQHLPQRRAGALLRKLAPQQGGELLTPVRARLERQIGQQPERLRARRWLERRAIGRL